MAWLKGLTLDPATWRKVWVDLVQAAMVSVTPGANKIPQADATGKLNVGWLVLPEAVSTFYPNAGAILTNTSSGSGVNEATTVRGATATASSTYNGGTVPSNVLDGNPATGWQPTSRSAGNWLRIDLGAPRSIARYRILQEAAGSSWFVSLYRLECSTDDSLWSTVASMTTTEDTGLVTLAAPLTARYWRWYQIVAANANAASVNLFELYSSTAVLSPVAIGTEGQVLTTVAGLPAWADAPSGTGDPPVGGDLTGTAAAATVAKLRGRTVAAASPSNGQALVWNNGTNQWEPGTVSGGTGIPGQSAWMMSRPAGVLARQYEFDGSLEGWAISGGGTLSAVGGSLVLARAGDSTSAMEPTTAQNIADGELLFDVMVSGGSGIFGIYLRASDINNGYEIVLRSGDGSDTPAINLYKVVSGSSTWVNRGAGENGVPSFWAKDTRLRMLIRFVGANITVYINDSFAASFVDTTFTTGRIGVGIYNTTLSLGTLRAYSLPSGWTPPLPDAIDPGTGGSGGGQPILSFSAARTGTSWTATGTPIIFNTVLRGSTGHGYDLTTGVWTVPTTGTYQITITGLSGPSWARFWLRVNGVSTGYKADTSTAYTQLAINVHLDLAAGATVDVYLEGGSVYNDGDSSYCVFSVVQLPATGGGGGSGRSAATRLFLHGNCR